MTDTAAVTLAAPATRFPLTTDALSGIAGEVLRAARAGGATAAETEVSQAFGLSVTVRKAEVETIAYNRDKGIALTVFIRQRRGHAICTHPSACTRSSERIPTTRSNWSAAAIN